VRAPVGGDAARDDEVAVNHRRCGACVRESEPPELLHERAFPEQFPLRREPGENALRALHEDVARFRVNRRRRRCVAQINRVAQKIVEQLLPEFLARLGVETRHALLQIRPLAEVTHDVEPPVGDDGRGLAGKLRAPERVLRINAVGQPRFARHAALFRPAPRQPAANRRGRVRRRRPQCRDAQRKTEQTSEQSAHVCFHFQTVTRQKTFKSFGASAETFQPGFRHAEHASFPAGVGA
jgi:hypothetical protein